MAKRYAKFEDLNGVSGSWNPAEVQSKHFATILLQGEKIIAVGSRSGRVTLSKGDTLGFEAGKVWIVSGPNSYKDTLRRFLSERKIPQRVLEPPMRDVSLQVDETWYDQSHCLVGRPTHKWMTDGEVTELSSEVTDPPIRGGFTGGGRREVSIENATFAIRVDYVWYINRGWYNRVARIVVWPGYDQNKVVEQVGRYNDQY